MDINIKQQIVIAAAQLAGANASTNAVLAEAKRIAALATPGSVVMNALDYEEERGIGAPASKPFWGTLLHVDIELSNSRVVLFYATDKGVESLRGDFTKNNPAAQAQARELSALIGHRLQLTRRLEPWKNNPKKSTNVLVTFEDKGLDQAAIAVPNFGMDWAAWDADEDKNPNSGNLKLASQGIKLDVQTKAA